MVQNLKLSSISDSICFTIPGDYLVNHRHKSNGLGLQKTTRKDKLLLRSKTQLDHNLGNSKQLGSEEKTLSGT
jgi:hypothetical protein